MSKRNKILLVAGGILILLALAYWLFVRPSYQAPGGNANEAVNTNTLPPSPAAIPSANVNSSLLETPVPGGEKIKSDLGRLAAAFAERFGSYSNQGNFENIIDLKVLMTEKMQRWADDLVARNSAGRTDNSIYSGVTTKAISTEVPDIGSGAGAVTITVKTQRRETSGSMDGNEKIVYQDLKLSLVKVGDEWKIDAASWQ